MKYEPNWLENMEMNDTFLNVSLFLGDLWWNPKSKFKKRKIPNNNNNNLLLLLFLNAPRSPSLSEMTQDKSSIQDHQGS